MELVRHTAGYSSLDHRRNEDILQELRVDPVWHKLAQYKQRMVRSCQQDGRH
jgi:hypothetical protein